MHNPTHKRIVVLLDETDFDHPELARAEAAARAANCPIHLIGFIDVNPLVHFGAHGPTIERSRYCRLVPRAYEAAERYLKSVAQKLTAKGHWVTYEIRTGLLQFELPAALKPGDLLFTSSERCMQASPQEFVIQLSPHKPSRGASPVLLSA